MRFEEENQAANQAAYSNLQHRHTHGFGVINGGEITINTGNLDANDTLSIEQSDILVNGTEHSVSAQSIQIDSTSTNTRRDIIYIDSSGNVQVAKGQEQEPQTSVTNPDYEDYVFPAPPDLAHVDATTLFEVWIPHNNSTITSSELLDRREDATLVAESLTVTGQVSADDIDADTGTVDTLTIVSGTVSDSPTAANDIAKKEYVDSVTQGLDWQDSVIDELNDPPSSPSTGDRYLIDDSPTGDWSGEANKIAEWDGSSWVFYDPNEGWAVYVEDVDLLKVFNNSDWIQFGSAIDHGALAGLGDDDHTQYLLVDGTRAMSGSLDMGSNAISNATDITASGAVTGGGFSTTGTTESGTYTVDGSTIAQSVVASGQVTLSSGEATVDTTISAVDATFTLALGVDDPNADVDLAGRLFWDDSAGTYKIDIVEATTSVGNPTANYDVVRVR